MRRWLAALALTLPAVVAFNAFMFGVYGALVVPLAVFGAAHATGYTRRDALGLAAGSAVVVAVGGSVPVLAYAIVTMAALRPPSRRAAGWRLMTLATAVVLAWHWHASWPALFIPALVAATDDAVDRLGAGPSGEAPPAEERRGRRSTAGTALTVASLSCLLLLTIPWLVSASADPWLALVFLGLAGGVASLVLALCTVRADPVRATAAIALSTPPILVWGLWLLIYLDGGLQIGN